MAAVLEEEYIFNWLAWDGDNMLASGAILDYGSIRQFAAKHDKYRFKDVDRYSASLAEQRYWARLIVQTFAQAMAFICSGEKQNIREFKDAESSAERLILLSRTKAITASSGASDSLRNR